MADRSQPKIAPGGVQYFIRHLRAVAAVAFGKPCSIRVAELSQGCFRSVFSIEVG